jgi:hypothetical protein
MSTSIPVPPIVSLDPQASTPSGDARSEESRGRVAIVIVGWSAPGLGGAVNDGRFSGPGVVLVTDNLRSFHHLDALTPQVPRVTSAV